jgi:hypothetical protein
MLQQRGAREIQGFRAVTVVTTLCWVRSACGLVGRSRRFGVAFYIRLQGRSESLTALKMETGHLSETSACTNQSARRFKPTERRQSGTCSRGQSVPAKDAPTLRSRVPGQQSAPCYGTGDTNEVLPVSCGGPLRALCTRAHVGTAWPGSDTRSNGHGANGLLFYDAPCFRPCR